MWLETKLQQLTHKGYGIINNVFSKKEVNRIKLRISNHLKSKGLPEDVHAIRDLLGEMPELKEVLLNPNMMRILHAVDPALFITKAIYFNKTQESNWYVTWHQDIVINVNERIETNGFSGWTKKSGVHGVVPPDEYLKNTITIRIHLDDTDEANGALKVVPGSHHKKLSDDEISVITQNSFQHSCDIPAGGVQLMKPLILHASSKATNQKNRRVVHLEFSSGELPGELDWAERRDLITG